MYGVTLGFFFLGTDLVVLVLELYITQTDMNEDNRENDEKKKAKTKKKGGGKEGNEANKKKVVVYNCSVTEPRDKRD